MTALFRYEDHTVADFGHFAPLTAHEAAVLGYLTKAKPRVVSFEHLCQELWPIIADQPLNFHNAVSVVIHKLRCKLQPFGLSIVNVHGHGYYLVGDISADWTTI